MSRRMLALFAVLAVTSLPRGTAAQHLDARWSIDPAAPEVERTIAVVDTTGDPRIAIALGRFATRWNAMVDDPSRGLDRLPRVSVGMADPSRGCATPPFDGLETRLGDVVVCRDDGLKSAGIGGPLWVDGRGRTRFGLVKLRGATLAWTECHLETAVNHEMGHVMGLDHRKAKATTGAPPVMSAGGGPYAGGCSGWFEEPDIAVLRELYSTP